MLITFFGIAIFDMKDSSGSRYLSWSTEDTEAFNKYKADLESGKAKPVTIEKANINRVLSRSS